MDGEGLEPSRIAPYAPKAYASTGSATRPLFYYFGFPKSGPCEARTHDLTLKRRLLYQLS